MATETLPPLDAEVGPDNLSRVQADIARAHVQREVVSDRLVRSLGIGLVVEFNKDRRDQLDITSTVLSLQFLDFRGETLNFGTSPVNSVNLLADQHLETVSGTVLGLDPASSDRARLIIELAITNF